MKDETILCIATRTWRSLWRDSQQIMSRLANQNRVVYFEPGRDPERSWLPELWRHAPYFVRPKVEILHENLILVPTPSSLPHARRHLPAAVLNVSVPLVSRFNAAVLIHHIRWAVRALDVHAPILWLYSPYHVDLIGKFNEKLACYYNYDELADFVHNRRIKGMLRHLDDELTDRADVVFATSRAQWTRRKAINPNTHFVPNGVDFDLFNRALRPDTPQPEDIRGLPRPIIGFAGWLGYHIDTDLLLRIAEGYPTSSLVLIGPDELPQTPSRQQLQTLPNVHFLGRKDRDVLPDYLREFDVALMPWTLDGHILSAYPLKLHEYLAAGRAIVATALPELHPFHHLIRIAGTHESFLRHIGEALDDHDPDVVAARVAVARSNTWDHRVADISRALQPMLDGKEASRP